MLKSFSLSEESSSRTRPSGNGVKSSVLATRRSCGDDDHGWVTHGGTVTLTVNSADWVDEVLVA
jgi:hypothetical protein